LYLERWYIIGEGIILGELKISKNIGHRTVALWRGHALCIGQM
jgi:hypothetical protein